MTAGFIVNQELFWAKVEKTTTCWLWLASKKENGYGMVGVCRSTNGKRSAKMFYAHRLAYEFIIGRIPEGKILHHLCGNRGCVNPSHLQPVSYAEHPGAGPDIERKKTHCPKGHSLSGDNLSPWHLKQGGRVCLTCIKLRNAIRRPKVGLARIGENSPNHKLILYEVKEIRKLGAEHGATRKQLAEKYHVSISNIDMILAGLTWKGVAST